MPDGINPDEVNRVVYLIQYLQRLATLRTRPVRDVRTYERKGKVLWLSDCPHEQGVFTQAWGNDEAHSQDKWLEVQNQSKPELPAVPDECEDWVNPEALLDNNNLPEQPELPTVPVQCKKWVNLEALWDTNEPPKLQTKITRQIPNPDWHEDSDQPETIPKTEHLKDYPKVEQEWDRYIQDEWLPWTEEYNEWKIDYMPKLLPEITRQIPNPDWHEDSDQPETIPKTEHLNDYPEVEQEWDRYIQDEWLPWTTQHNAWKKVHEVYSKLFAIRQIQLRSDEEYELVLGVGLLTWQTPNNQHVRRHLVVADAFLEFEAHLGKFTVRPSTSGARLRLELDMLEEQPALAEGEARGLLEQAEDNPWKGDHVEAALQALRNTIHPQGEVEYTPALILRQRHVIGLTETLSRIGEQIENNGVIPSEFARLAEIQPQNEPDLGNEQGEANAAFDNANFDSEVFFPLPSNDEQRRIVGKI